MCGGAYTFKSWERPAKVDSFKDNEAKHAQDPWTSTLIDTASSSSRPDLVSTDSRPRYGDDPERPENLVGMREGEWFKQWEGVIRMSVLNRVNDLEPMVEPPNNVNIHAAMLDGYRI